MEGTGVEVARNGGVLMGVPPPILAHRGPDEKVPMVRHHAAGQNRQREPLAHFFQHALEGFLVRHFALRNCRLPHRLGTLKH
jgi:hypothetical protein